MAEDEGAVEGDSGHNVFVHCLTGEAHALTDTGLIISYM